MNTSPKLVPILVVAVLGSPASRFSPRRGATLTALRSRPRGQSISTGQSRAAMGRAAGMVITAGWRIATGPAAAPISIVTAGVTQRDLP